MGTVSPLSWCGVVWVWNIMDLSEDSPRVSACPCCSSPGACHVALSGLDPGEGDRCVGLCLNNVVFFQCL